MKKILIIEDDQIVGNIYRNKFTVEGFQVDISRDGVAGLEDLRRFRPDAVILDLMLPKLNGVEVMKQIRADPDFKALPVIVFSNTYLTNLVQEAWKAGATKCLSKANCTPKQVIEVVRGALGLHPTPAPAPHPRAGGDAAPAEARAVATAVAPAPSTVAATADAEFQAGLCTSFREGLPVVLSRLRLLLQGLIRADDEATRHKEFAELYRRIRALTGSAGVAGARTVARMAEALEALLKDLNDKPKTINASTLRTVASAIDLLGVLCERGLLTDDLETPPPAVLVVDDEDLSRRAVTYALGKSRLKPVTAETCTAAYELLAAGSFDLVFLDVDMPDMSGFELCARLRQLPAHKKTPVVFVTGLTDFQSRTSSMMSGGNDFIAKPFLFTEVAVKALLYVLRGRLSARK